MAALGGPPVPMPPADSSPAAAVPQCPVTGNPTFDEPPPAVVARRQTVAECRARLRELLAFVSGAADGLYPLLNSLHANAAEVLKGDGFDVTAARKFLAEVTAPIHALTEKAETLKR